MAINPKVFKITAWNGVDELLKPTGKSNISRFFPGLQRTHNCVYRLRCYHAQV